MIKTSAISYMYRQTNGRFAARNLVCASDEVEVHLNRLINDKNAKNVKLV